MATTFAVPLVSTLDSSHHVRGHSQPSLNQYRRSGSRLTTKRPFPLSRIPSERLDPRSESFGLRMSASVRNHEEHTGVNRLDAVTSTTNTPISAPSPYLLRPSKREENTTNVGPSRGHFHRQASDLSLPGAGSSGDQVHAPKMPSRSRFRNQGRKILAGILVPLPYILTSFLSAQRAAPSLPPAGTLTSSPSSELVNHLFFSLLLTSLTLAILGAYGIYKRRSLRLPYVQYGLNLAEGRVNAPAIKIDTSTCLRIVQRTTDVALPYAVALQLNSLFVSLLLLVKISSGLLPMDMQKFPLSHLQAWKRLLAQKRWTLSTSCLLCLSTLKYGSRTQLSFWVEIAMVAALAVFCNPPYYYSVKAAHERSLMSPPPPTRARPAVPSTASWNEDDPSSSASQKRAPAPLIGSIEAITLTVMSAGFAAVAASLLYLLYNIPGVAPSSAVVLVVVPFLTTWSFLGIEVSPTPALLASGSAVALVSNLLVFSNPQSAWRDTILTVLAFTAVRLDATKSTPAAEDFVSSANEKSVKHSNEKVSGPTQILLQSTERYSILHGILTDKDSRRIFYFMLLNLCFMLVQSTYGVLTGSLGLISDSIHMFFDCVALCVGLCAAVMSKWPPSMKYPYGYGKIDTLSGFGNGIFLMLISIEIIWEGIERLVGGSDLSRTTELLVVSILGLLVNLVGILAFDHGHAHGHGHGHDHGHSHGGHHHGDGGHSHSLTGHGRSHSQSSTSSSTAKTKQSEHHHHHHGGDNMHGIYLHILADTLGSGAVVASTLCVQYTGWSGFDPLASCAIAILIFASAVPLIIGCGKKMLLSMPSDVEYKLRETLAGVSTIRGVVAYTVPKFWLDDVGKKALEDDQNHDHHHDHSCDNHHHHQHAEKPSHLHPHHHSDPHSHSHDSDSNHSHSHEAEEETQLILGVIHIIAAPHADLEDVRTRVVDYLQSNSMDILVQVERDGDCKCWCGGGKPS